MKKIFLAVMLSMFLASCATPYQPLGYDGGYSQFILSKDVYQISFSGNGYSSQDYVRNNLLRRCAEVTLQNEYQYFEILGGNMSSSQSAWVTPATVQSNTYSTFNAYGNSNYTYGSMNQSSNTTIAPSQVSVITKHTAVAVIKLVYSNKNAKAFDATVILSNFKAEP